MKRALTVLISQYERTSINKGRVNFRKWYFPQILHLSKMFYETGLLVISIKQYMDEKRMMMTMREGKKTNVSEHFGGKKPSFWCCLASGNSLLQWESWAHRELLILRRDVKMKCVNPWCSFSSLPLFLLTFTFLVCCCGVLYTHCGPNGICNWACLHRWEAQSL